MCVLWGGKGRGQPALYYNPAVVALSHILFCAVLLSLQKLKMKRLHYFLSFGYYCEKTGNRSCAFLSTIAQERRRLEKIFYYI